MSICLYNPALLTPEYNGQFRLSKRKAHIFSVKLTSKTDNENFSVSRVTNSRTSSTLLYGHRVSVHFHNICHCVIIIALYPVQLMTDFLALIRFHYSKTVAK